MNFSYALKKGPRRPLSLCAALLISLFCSLLAFGQEPPAQEGPVFGIWESPSRFLEISAEGQVRIVLKPYYSFVYEDAGWIPCAVSGEAASAEEGVYTLSVSYPGQKIPQELPVAVIGGTSLYTRFYSREEQPAGAPSNAPLSDPGIDEEAAAPDLSGFWEGYGDAGGMRLYGQPPADEFFCLYFDGSRYYRIRYWLTDARFRDLRATFAGSDSGESGRLSVPKFIRRGGFLYTCVTGTGTVLRNYEQGSWEMSEGAISFQADSIMFAGGAASETLTLRLSADASIMALGAPQFERSEISSMDAEIAEHNSRRRPPRMPPLELMELDFQWDEIERLRQ